MQRTISFITQLFFRGIFAILLLLTVFCLFSNSEEAVMPWPNNEIKIYDQTDRPRAMRAGARIWNSTGLGVKIRLVDDRGEADVIAESVERFTSPGCGGEETIGCAAIGNYSPLPWKKPIFQLKARHPFEKDDGRGKYGAVAAHEIGHLLGMDHNREKCSLMNSRANCRQVHRGFYIASDCPILNDTLALDPTEFCPSRFTQVLKCGPSYDEIEQLRLRYGGRRNVRYRSFCQSEQQTRWRAWCLYPGFQPADQERPEWLIDTPDGPRCSERTPARYLAVISYAVEEVARQRAELLTRRPDLDSRGAYQKMTEIERMTLERIGRLSRLEARYRAMMPERLRPALN